MICLLCRGSHSPTRRLPAWESRRTSLPILLHIPLHANGTDPEGAHDFRLSAVAVLHQLAGEHAEGGIVLFLMGKYRHRSVEVVHSTCPFGKRHMRVNGGDVGGKQR